MPVLLQHLILVPFVLTLLVIFGLALYYAAFRPVTSRRRASAKIYRCSACAHVYVFDRDVPLARCPRCACLNEAVKR